MATFSFDPSFLDNFSAKERGVLETHGSKKDGRFLISQQSRYRVELAEVAYKVNLEREVHKKSVPSPVYKRRKYPKLRKDLNGGFDNLVSYDVQRVSYKIEKVVKQVVLESPGEGRIKYGKFWWDVVDTIPIPKEVSETVEIEGDSPKVGDLLGQKMVVSCTKINTGIDRLISRLCELQNNGVACISGQLHTTTKTCHASREPKPLEAISYAQVAADSGKLKRNKLAEIKPLSLGDYSERTVFDKQGKFVSRELSVASDNSSFEPAKEFVTVALGSGQYKPLPLPKQYKECDSVDKADTPVTVNLTEAEKRLKSMGYL